MHPDPRPGDELAEASVGSRLRFVRTRDAGGVLMHLAAPAGWTAGPMHVHPATTERLTVLEGELTARLGRIRRHVSRGGLVVVPAGMPHTVAARSHVLLAVEFEPPLRTDRLFYEMYGGGPRRGPSRRLPQALRAWLESRGYGEEIRYLWPRRLAAGAALAGALLLGRAARRREPRRSGALKGRTAARNA